MPRSLEADSLEPQDELIVLLKLSEEAKCMTPDLNCNYTWIGDSELPQLQSYSVSWDTSINDFVVTLVGTGFPATTNDVTFIIDGVN